MGLDFKTRKHLLDSSKRCLRVLKSKPNVTPADVDDSNVRMFARDGVLSLSNDSKDTPHVLRTYCAFDLEDTPANCDYLRFLQVFFFFYHRIFFDYRTYIGKTENRTKCPKVRIRITSKNYAAQFLAILYRKIPTTLKRKQISVVFNLLFANPGNKNSAAILKS